jgi:hypothetical protein
MLPGSIRDGIPVRGAKRLKPVRCRCEIKKRRVQNGLLANRILCLLPAGLSFDKRLAFVGNALNLGVKAAYIVPGF